MEFSVGDGRLLPGFRFNPTDVELVMYYLKRKVLGKPLDPTIIEEVDIYKFHPQDLRELSYFKKDLCWYFFCPRGKKYGNGARLNRATETGYWKATGVDRIVLYEKRTVGKIKTLVFHLGKPPKGERTDWVMHEFRLDDKNLADVGVCQDLYSLCKIFKKSGLGPKNGEQYGAPFIEQEWDDNIEIPSSAQLVPLPEVDNASPASTLEQVYSGPSNSLITSYGKPVNLAPTIPMPNAADWASHSNGLISSYNPAVDQAYNPMLMPADYDPAVQMPAGANIASTSMGPVLNYDNDEIFTVDELRGMFGDLEDLDNSAVHRNEFDWENIYEGGMGLTDLDESL